MKTLDLFSGVGGISFALRGGIADTVTYCDIDPFARAVLSANMRRGKIPTAFISDDVRSITAASVGPIDMIVAGFPCVGMSSIGLREGFKNSETGLFKEVLRLIDEFDRPDYVFLENVPGIMKRGMNQVVYELNKKRGYELRWGIVGAWQMGAPHMRNRWFMLARRADARPRKLSIRPVAPFPWAQGEPVPRLTRECKREHLLRCAAMGNGVCPDAVRQAFVLLASGCKEERGLKASSVRLAPMRLSADGTSLRPNPCVEKAAEWPRFGVITAPSRPKQYGIVHELPDLLQREKVDLGLVIVPPVITTRRGINPLVSRTILKKPVRLAHWATPRYGNTGAVNVLTDRTVMDLASQLRYERRTPAVLRREGHANGEFLEWMMGYPKGFTRPW